MPRRRVCVRLGKSKEMSGLSQRLGKLQRETRYPEQRSKPPSRTTGEDERRGRRRRKIGRGEFRREIHLAVLLYKSIHGSLHGH